MQLFENLEETAQLIEREIDVACAASKPARYRWYMPVSKLGDECAARLWNEFRWIRKSQFTGQQSRRVDAGTALEPVIREYLISAGWKMRPLPPNGKQHRVEDFEGHLKGYLDDIAGHDEFTGGQDVLFEYKTAEQKYFNPIAKKGLALSEFQYYVQFQVYCKYHNLPGGVVVVMNKNTGELHVEIIKYNDSVAVQYITRAGDAIKSQTRLRKISEKPTYHVCRSCTFHANCHEGATPEINCRSCRNCHPAPERRWHCSKYEMLIPKEALEDGCGSHESII